MTEHAPDSGKTQLLTESKAALELDRLRSELAAARRELDERDQRSRAELLREAVLRHELQHWVRNTLALVRSVFTRTIATGETLEEVDSHFRGRLNVLARYQGGRAGGYPSDLEDLIRNELHDFRFGDLPGITLRGPDVAVTPDHAQPLALAMHELVTNALKFGALSVKDATLSITWSVSDDVLELVWTEAGVPILGSAPPRRGFSRQFIEEALPYETGAETRLELRPGGVLCQIHLPLPRNDVVEEAG